MRSRFTLFSALCLCLPTLAQSQMSDLSCDDSARLTQRLSSVLGADKQGVGLRDPETMVEVWVTPHSGDWMIVQSYANGTSCIVAMGEYWQAALREPA